jgi:GT2 family glycosyltransferase
MSARTNSKADVSIIIVTRNTREQTAQAVESVFQSKDSLRKEVVVVDNGSTDGTPELMRAKFPDARYLRQERNLGFAAANNLGARGTKAEFLLLLNSDARLQPGALAEAVAWMRAHPECGIVGAQLLNPDDSRQNSIANFPTLATELLNKSLLRRLFPNRFPGKERRLTAPAEVESVIGAFMLVRNELWKALGGFDERYFFFFEETDFCLCARRQGWKIYHLPQVQVWHEQGKSAKQLASGARIEYWRSRYIYFRKHHSRAAQVVLAAGLGLRLFVNWLASLLVVMLSFGAKSVWRDKLRVHTALLKWHVRGCPLEMGLPR